MALILDGKHFQYDGTPWYETVELTLRDFRATNNKLKTTDLFHETINRQHLKDGVIPIFTLDTEHDFEYKHYGNPLHLYSFKRLYLDHRDPQEYLFAQSVLGSWEHWLQLNKRKWFTDRLNVWRKELEIKLRSESVSQLYKKAMSGDVNAGKFISSQSWKHIYRPPGKPSKEHVEAEAKKEAMFKQELSDDYERILEFAVDNVTPN